MPAVAIPWLSFLGILGAGFVPPVVMGAVNLVLAGVSLLIGVAGLVMVRSASGTRRGVAAGVLVVAVLLAHIFQWVLQILVSTVFAKGDFSTAMGFSIAGAAVLGLVVTTAWVSAWLVVRRSPGPGWFVALPVSTVVPVVCSLFVQLSFGESSVYVLPATGAVLVELLCFVGAILLAERFARRAHRSRRDQQWPTR